MHAACVSSAHLCRAAINVARKLVHQHHARHSLGQGACQPVVVRAGSNCRHIGAEALAHHGVCAWVAPKPAFEEVLGPVVVLPVREVFVKPAHSADADARLQWGFL